MIAHDFWFANYYGGPIKHRLKLICAEQEALEAIAFQRHEFIPSSDFENVSPTLFRAKYYETKAFISCETGQGRDDFTLSASLWPAKHWPLVSRYQL